jgi:hypothetical protein
MAKSGFQRWLEKVFPSEDGGGKTNALVEQGLEALRLARDERAFTMGDVRRVPSRLELRLSPERFDELKGMDASRDLEFFFNDELMKDLSAEGMRTFGDHAVHVTIAADPDLGPDEMYAEVLAPEAGGPPGGEPGERHRPGQRPAPDATRVMGDPADEEHHGASTVAIPPAPRLPVERWTLRITGPGGFNHTERLEGRGWIIGRRGSTGRPVPTGYRKVDLDVRETVSREQVKVDIMEDRLQIERIGKGVVSARGEDLREGERRLIPLGSSFMIDQYELVINR